MNKSTIVSVISVLFLLTTLDAHAIDKTQKPKSCPLLINKALVNVAYVQTAQAIDIFRTDSKELKSFRIDFINGENTILYVLNPEEELKKISQAMTECQNKQ
jgi:hypothetical protein